MSLSNSFEGSFSDVKDPMDWRMFTPSPKECWILWQMSKEYFKVFCGKKKKNLKYRVFTGIALPVLWIYLPLDLKKASV